MLSSSKKAIIILFFIFLGHGILGVFVELDHKNFGLLEERAPAIFPVLDKIADKNIRRYCNAFEDWFSDRFFGRQQYITAYQSLPLAAPQITKQSSFIFGKEGWLFLGNKYQNVLDYTQNYQIVSDKVVKKKVDYFEKLKNECAAFKVPFVALIAPNKHTIYPEFMPSWMTTQKPDERLADKVALEVKNRALPVVFPRAALEKAKNNKTRLYYTDDTHWNASGAYIALLELAKELQKQDKTIMSQINSVQLKPIERLTPGELIRISRLPLSFLDHEGYQYVFDDQIKAPYTDKKLLILGDSFASTWLPLLQVFFKEVVLIHVNQTPDSLNAILAEQAPDVLIYEIVERHFPYSEAMRTKTTP